MQDNNKLLLWYAVAEKTHPWTEKSHPTEPRPGRSAGLEEGVVVW